MSEDLDDGEILVENHATQVSGVPSAPAYETNGHKYRRTDGDLVNMSRDRNIPPDQSRRGAAPSSRYGRTEAMRHVESKKAPSIHDANTKADIDRLAREAEAAAYKARTAVLKKGPARSENQTSLPRPPMRTRSPRESSPRRRSRSPGSAHRRSSDQSLHSVSAVPTGPRRRSPDHARSPLIAKSFISTRESRESPVRDKIRNESVRDKALTAADIGRLEREKEAAAYKARVSAEATKSKQVEPTHKSYTTPVASCSTMPLQESSTRPGTSAHQAQKLAQDSAKEIVQKIQSRTPKLDQQIHTHKVQYESLNKVAMTKEIAVFAALQNWINADRELKREEHKSELAQQSLDAMAIS